MQINANKTKPRAGAEIDWSDPITKGLQTCLLFNNGNAKREIDLVSKITFVPYNGSSANTIKNQGSEYGQALYAEGAMVPENYATFDNRWNDQVATVIIGAKENRTDGYGGYGGISNATGGNAFKFQWDNSTTNFNITGILNNPFAVPSVTLTPPKNDPRVAGAVISKNGFNVYLNGLLAGNVASASTLYPYNGMFPFVAAGDVQYNGGNTDLYFAYFWNRELTADEVLKISKDPFCFIKKPKKFFAKLSGFVFTQNLTENQSFSDLLTKLTGKRLTDSQTNSDSLIKQTGKRLTENQTIADVLTAIRTFLKVLTENFTNTDGLIKRANKTLSEVQSYTDTIIKAVTRTFNENQTFADTLASVKVFLKTLIETFTSTDSLTKRVNKTLSDTQSYVDTVIKQVSKWLTENQSFSDFLNSVKVFLKSLTETIIYTDSLIKRVAKTFSESSLISDFLTKIYTPIGGAVINIKNYILKLIFKNSTSIKNSKKNFEIRNKK